MEPSSICPNLVAGGFFKVFADAVEKWRHGQAAIAVPDGFRHVFVEETR